MNIFVLSKSRKKCAKYHCNAHVVKMILEYAQILCSAIWSTGIEAPYKKTHMNHPCSIWTRQSKKNWKWLHGLAILLCEEYTYRYEKIHKTESIIRSLTCPEIENGPFTNPPQAMPDYCKVENDPVQAYRNYYNKEKTHILKWKKRNIPYFIEIQS